MMAFIRGSALGRYLVAPLVGAAVAFLIAGMYMLFR
jgi:hypothetical protein